MKRSFPEPAVRSLALFVALLLALPNPVLALREMQPVQNAGLEEDLAAALGRPVRPEPVEGRTSSAGPSADLRAGLEEWRLEFAPGYELPPQLEPGEIADIERLAIEAWKPNDPKGNSPLGSVAPRLSRDLVFGEKPFTPLTSQEKVLQDRIQDIAVNYAGEDTEQFRIIVLIADRLAHATIVPAAGLEEGIPLGPAATEKKVIFVTPDMANSELFESLKVFKPAPGKQLQLVIFAEHEFHATEIENWLKQAGLAAVEIVNVKQQLEEHEGWNLFDVVAYKQALYWSGTDAEIHTVWFYEDLKNLGRFLGIDLLQVRTWEESLERQFGTQL